MDGIVIRDYELVREEMLQLKKCVTDYMGYVVGGSGAAAFGLFAVSSSSQQDFAYASLSLSVMISFVLLILFYKFNSHNRYAGYCKLLNHERITNSDLKMELLLWETCIARLRHYTVSPDSLPGLFASLKIQKFESKDIQNLQALVGWYINRCSDKHKSLKGLGILIPSLFGRVKATSWNFPPYVVSLFFVLTYGFLVSGLIATYRSYVTAELQLTSLAQLDISNDVVLLAQITIVILAGQLFIWWGFCGKLFTLLKGGATVDSFFWRFLPIRASLLNIDDVSPSYLLARERCKEAVQQFQLTKVESPNP